MDELSTAIIKTIYENNNRHADVVWAAFYRNPIIESRSNELAKTINFLTVSGEIGHNTNRIWFVSTKWKDFYDNEKNTDNFNSITTKDKITHENENEIISRIVIAIKNAGFGGTFISTVLRNLKINGSQEYLETIIEKLKKIPVIKPTGKVFGNDAEFIWRKEQDEEKENNPWVAHIHIGQIGDRVSGGGQIVKSEGQSSLIITESNLHTKETIKNPIPPIPSKKTHWLQLVVWVATIVGVIISAIALYNHFK